MACKCDASRKKIAAIICASSPPQIPLAPSGQLLVLGHYDTVYASGTLKKMPFRVAAGKTYGPGTFDMKAGIVQALFAYDPSKTKLRSHQTHRFSLDLR